MQADTMKKQRRPAGANGKKRFFVLSFKTSGGCFIVCGGGVCTKSRLEQGPDHFLVVYRLKSR